MAGADGEMLTVTQELLLLSGPVLATSPDLATRDQDQDHEIQAKVTTTAPGSRHLQPTEGLCANTGQLV